MTWIRSMQRAATRPLLLALALAVAGCTVRIEIADPSPTATTGAGSFPGTSLSTPTANVAPIRTPPAVVTTASPTAPQPARTAIVLPPTPATSPTPRVTVAPATAPPLPSPTAIVVPPASGTCRPVNLAAQVTWDAGAGSRNGTITIRSGGDPCTLPGFPTIQVMNSQGPVLPVMQENDALDGSTARANVTVRPGQQAIVAVRWTNYCGLAADQPTSLRLVFPNGEGVTPTGGVSVPPCLGDTRPSTLYVQPVRLDDPAAAVVRSFYDAINSRDYGTAYNLRAADYQAQQSYDDFAAGYQDTALAMVFITDAAPTPDGRWTVIVRIAAQQSDQSTQRFAGSYTIARENGALKIVAADIAPR